MWMLLGNRWVQLALAVGITFLVSYSWGRYTGYSNEHKERLTERAQWEAVVEAANAKTQKLQAEFTRVLGEVNNDLVFVNNSLKELQVKNDKLFKENRELLKRIRVPDVATRLLDSASGSVQPETPKEQAEQGSNGSTTMSDLLQATEEYNRTLDEVIEVEMQNRGNHLNCIAQVNALQTIVCGLYAADGQPLEYESCQDAQ